ncbi:MAG: S-methyl-5-thioribose-1-phosphate isomerase [Pseudomonadales bacterium]|nr:S-methyl-5-thioribose-1-phosphate isomerase [Pseudomonadales bacterium]
MQVHGTPHQSIWLDEQNRITIIDQTRLPYEFKTKILSSLEDFARAIEHMEVRGAPLIGITAAFGLAMTLKENPSFENEEAAATRLLRTRPTAINLKWAVDRIRAIIKPHHRKDVASIALTEACSMLQHDMDTCEKIGDFGLEIIRRIHEEKTGKDKTVNILTHCNAGWLATVDWGTATAPIYKAHLNNIPVHVWVDETRPRNQGAITAWELGQQGVPHTYVTDNTGGHLMQHGMVDLCIVGSDRTTARGDVCNKIGTYLKALAATANKVPFYTALPTSTIDWQVNDGILEIPIEQRSPEEITFIQGTTAHNDLEKVRVTPPGSPVANFAFDVTPAHLVSGLITEFGVFEANASSLKQLRETIEKP